MISRNLALLAGTLLAGTAAHALTFTCSTVARRGQPAGETLVFRTNYPLVAINGAGDVAFTAKLSGGAVKLYRSPAVGPFEIVARRGDASPGIGTYTDFKDVSINDAGSIGFKGRLLVGEGVYVHPPGGPTVKVVETTEASPGGGFFGEFNSASRVNAGGDIAFVADVSGGPTGVFLYQAAGPAIVPVALQGGPTDEGRELCSFLNVGLGDGGGVAFQAISKVSCADLMEADKYGIHLAVPPYVGPVTTAARQDLVSPLGTAVYNRFYEAPEVDAAGNVQFRARVFGQVNIVAHFLFQPVGPATSTLVRVGDGAPLGAGGIKTLGPGGLTDPGGIAFRSKLVKGSAKQGIFVFGGSQDTVVTTNSAPPLDAYGVGSRYKRLEEDPGVDRSGTRVAFVAKVKDSNPPGGKPGVFRCTGS